MKKYRFGNENTTTPITNTNIIWGAIAAAAVGATVADWQRQREEERRKQEEASQGTNNAGRKKYEEMMKKKRIIGESQALLDEKRREKEIRADEELEKAWNKSRREHSLETMSAVIASQAAQKQNAGGSKPLAKPIKDGPNPPDDLSWWDQIKNWWSGLWGNSASTDSVATQTPMPSATLPPTITILPSATSTPGTPKIYTINGPMTIDQIPPEFRCTLPEKKIINGKELYSDYYYRCKVGEQLMVGLLTDPNGWWWQDGQTKYTNREKNVEIITEWIGVKTNEDFWRLALAYGLDTEGTTLRRDNVNGYRPLIEQAIINKFWHFDNGVYSTYGNGAQDPDTILPLGTDGRLIALGSLETLQKRVDGPYGFITNNQNASYGIVPPKDNFGNSTVMWMESWNIYANLFANEPTWIEPPANAPYEIGNKDSTSVYFNMPIGRNQGEVLYRSEKPEGVEYASELDIRAIVLNYQQVQYQNALGLK